MVLIHLVAELCADGSQKMDFPSHDPSLASGWRAADWGIPERVKVARNRCIEVSKYCAGALGELRGEQERLRYGLSLRTSSEEVVKS
jgi:hypothetical protein